jgi:hypothetical protein
VSTLIVGFGNKARHGKDTVASYVHQALPADSRLYAFGRALKGFARVLGMKGKDGPLLQALGTDVLRRIDPDIWVRVLAEEIEEDQPRIALIPDVRFVNEADFIRRSGGLLVRVVRLNEDRSPWIAKDRDSTHVSEIALDHYRFDVEFPVVSGDFEGLRKAAHLVTEMIQQRNHERQTAEGSC